MKHLILTSALFLTATLGFAQNITEPEYKGQQRGAKERLRYLQVRNQEEGAQIQDGRHRLRKRIGYHQFHHRGL